MSKILKDLDGMSVVEMLDRISVLRLCREAMDVGVKIQTLPDSTKKCGRILQDLITAVIPGYKPIVRYYSTAATASCRAIIPKNYQITMFPWAIEINPLTNYPSVPVHRLFRWAFPTSLGSGYECRKVDGPIGDFAEASGFSVMYRQIGPSSVLLYPGSPVRFSPDSFEKKQTYGRQDTNDETKRINGMKRHFMQVTKSNVISPVDFATVLSYIHKHLMESADRYFENLKSVAAEREELAKLFEQKPKPQVKKVEKAPEPKVVKPATPVVQIQKVADLPLKWVTSFVPGVEKKEFTLKKVDAPSNIVFRRLT